MRDRGPPPRHNGAVKAYLVETDGSSAEDVDAERVRRALAAGTLLWLDIDEADDEAVAVLRDVFELHPIALENAAVFRQRPRIEGYEDFSYLVAYGARGGEAGDPSGTGGAAGADGRLGAEHDGGTDHGAARDAHRGAGRHDLPDVVSDVVSGAAPTAPEPGPIRVTRLISVTRASRAWSRCTASTRRAIW